MAQRLDNERGSAMLLALAVLAVLGASAIIITAIVTTEKRTSFSEYTSSRSFYSADAAGEAGVNWLRHQTGPPDLLDTLSNVHLDSTYTTLNSQNRYKFDVLYVSKRYRPGWSTDYKDYEYRVAASGASAQQAAVAVQVTAMRLYREGY